MAIDPGTATIASTAIGALSGRRGSSTKSRGFARYMSDTAVTRRMEDMKNAGINPILAGKYDASTPSAQALMPATHAQGAMAGAAAATAMANVQKTAVETFLSSQLEPGARALSATMEVAETWIKDVIHKSKINDSASALEQGAATLTEIFEKADKAAVEVINVKNRLIQQFGEAAETIEKAYSNFTQGKDPSQGITNQDSENFAP